MTSPQGGGIRSNQQTLRGMSALKEDLVACRNDNGLA